MKLIRFLAIALTLVIIALAAVSCNSEDTQTNKVSDATEESDKATQGRQDATENSDIKESTEAPEATEKEEGQNGSDDGSSIGELDSEKLTLFKDGVYNAYIIRSESADDTAKRAYGEMRSTVKNKVGTMAKATTDFDKELADCPAVLIGKTDFAESKEVYDTLKSGEAAARFINGKYVIVYTSTQGADVVMKKVCELIEQVEGTDIIIDSSWNIDVSFAQTIGYTDEQLKYYIEVPEYNGRAFDQFAVDLGQNSMMHIAENTNEEEYSKYIAQLFAEGFESYATNVIGDNQYFTFTTEAQIVTAMYLDAFKETRVIVDNRAEFDPPEHPKDYDMVEPSEPSLTVTGIGATGWPGGMGYVYKLADGTFFIIDGGIDSSNSDNVNSAEWLMGTLEELADDPDNIIISGWLITHIHVDHLGAFVDMAKSSKYTDKITVETVIYNQPTDLEMRKAGIPERIPWMQAALDVWKPKNLIKAHPGQVYYFYDLTVTVLASQDVIVPDSDSSHNNLSIVTMVNFGGLDALYLGDAEVLMNRALEKLYGEELDCDILQLAHHGYNGTGADAVYEIASPSIVFWPVNTAHYKGIVKNVAFNQRFFEPGITNHVAGETNMTIKDLVSWVPEERWTPKLS